MHGRWVGGDGEGGGVPAQIEAARSAPARPSVDYGGTLATAFTPPPIPPLQIEAARSALEGPSVDYEGTLATKLRIARRVFEAGGGQRQLDGAGFKVGPQPGGAGGACTHMAVRGCCPSR